MSDKTSGISRRLAIAAGALALSALIGALIWRRVRPDRAIGEPDDEAAA